MHEPHAFAKNSPPASNCCGQDRIRCDCRQTARRQHIAKVISEIGIQRVFDAYSYPPRHAAA